MNNDGRCTPLDVLIVINHIHAGSAGAGEAEAVLAVTASTREHPVLPSADAWAYDHEFEAILDDIGPDGLEEWMRLDSGRGL